MTDLLPAAAPPVTGAWWAGVSHPATGTGLPPSVLARLDWYTRNLGRARRLTHAADVATLLFSAAVPVVVAAGAPAWTAAVLGGLAAVVAGSRQAFGWQQNWSSFTRALLAIEALVVAWSTADGPFADPATAARTLAREVERITAEETGTWSQRLRPDDGQASRATA